MLTLAIDNSYGNFSAALLSGSSRLGSIAETVNSRDHNRLFELIAELIDKCSVRPGDIRRYVVGRGPGNYAGIRTAFSIVQGMALPQRAELIAVSSGAAIAWRVLQDFGCRRIAVIGDARRQRYWAGVFSLESARLVVEEDWRLCTRDELPITGKNDLIVASPEMESLIARHGFEFAEGLPLIEEDALPSAFDLGSIAISRRESGQTDEPFDPIYMHPAV